MVNVSNNGDVTHISAAFSHPISPSGRRGLSSATVKSPDLLNDVSMPMLTVTSLKAPLTHSEQG